MRSTGACKLSARRVYSRFLRERLGPGSTVLDGNRICWPRPWRRALEQASEDIDGTIGGQADGWRAAGVRGWGETMAAYRFFDNDEVEWSAILEPHWRQTEQRMAGRPRALGHCLTRCSAGCICIRPMR
jgi:hypothetical protein